MAPMNVKVTRRALAGDKNVGKTTWMKVMSAMAMVNYNYVGQHKNSMIAQGGTAWYDNFDDERMFTYPCCAVISQLLQGR
jgi:hypothetical protein